MVLVFYLNLWIVILTRTETKSRIKQNQSLIMQWTVPLEQRHLLWTPSYFLLLQTLYHTRPEHARQSQKELQSPVKWQKINENKLKRYKKDHSGIIDKQTFQRLVKFDLLKYLYFLFFFLRKVLQTQKLVTYSDATGPNPCCRKSDPCKECLPGWFLNIPLWMGSMRAWNKLCAKFQKNLRTIPTS